MAHLRQQIRDKVKLLLEQATGRPVFVNRSKQISPDDLPCLLITTDRDQNTEFTLGAFRRDIALTVRIFQKSFRDADNLLDDLCVQVENAISDQTDIAWDDVMLTSTEISLFGEGDQPIAVAKMDYIVTLLSVGDPEKTI